MSQQITGIGRYNLELLSRLVATDHQWFLYANRPIVQGDWQQHNVTQRIDRFPGELRRHVWAQTLLPWRARADKLDLFWCPTHRLPQFLPSGMARVVTIHDLVWKHFGDTMRRSTRLAEAVLMPQAVRLADMVMADSRHTERDLHEAYPFTRDKTRVVPLGRPVDAPPLGAPSPLIASLPERYILFVGTLEPRKNLRRLLEAYGRLDPGLRASVKLVIAGGKGWGGIDVETLAAVAGVADDVVLAGYVEDADMPGLYRGARLIAMPSLYEGFGLPLLEAMAVGTPVLTSDRSSLPEVAGDAGILVDPEDTDAIAGGLARLLRDDGLHRALAEKALQQAAAFSWERTTRETMAVFEEAIDRRRRRMRERGWHG